MIALLWYPSLLQYSPLTLSFVLVESLRMLDKLIFISLDVVRRLPADGNAHRSLTKRERSSLENRGVNATCWSFAFDHQYHDGRVSVARVDRLVNEVTDVVEQDQAQHRDEKDIRSCSFLWLCASIHWTKQYKQLVNAARPRASGTYFWSIFVPVADQHIGVERSFPTKLLHMYRDDRHVGIGAIFGIEESIKSRRHLSHDLQ